MNSKPVVAMAVGGVGGFNAHDAGVLSAAHECGLTPDIITCTSGAIFWTHLFLTDPDSIRAQVEQQAAEVNGATALQVAVLGDPGVFRPAYASYLARWFTPPSGPPVRALLDRLFPAQLYQPTLTPEFFTQVAEDLSRASTPVAFNAYAVSSGHELVFCNQAAFAFLGLSPGHTRPHDIPGDDVVTEYQPIDADAVRAALWLTLYGFANRYQGETAIDGAYQRQLIISELTRCDVIYAIKPQASAWRARAAGQLLRGPGLRHRDGPQRLLRRRGGGAAGGQDGRYARTDQDRADHLAPSAGLLQLLRREAAGLHRGLRASQESVQPRPNHHTARIALEGVS